MVPFWVPIIIRHLIFRVPKKDHNLTTTHMYTGLRDPQARCGRLGKEEFSGFRGLGNSEFVLSLGEIIGGGSSSSSSSSSSMMTLATCANHNLQPRT